MSRIVKQHSDTTLRAQAMFFFTLFINFISSFLKSPYGQGPFCGVAIAPSPVLEIKLLLWSESSGDLSTTDWNKRICCCLVSCIWLFCDPRDCSLPGSSVHGVLQARILEWVAISSSRGSPRPRDRTCVSCIVRQILYQWATREANKRILYIAN